MGVPGSSTVTCGMQPGRWEALCAVAGASLTDLTTVHKQPAAAPCPPAMPLSPAPAGWQAAQLWPSASLRLPAAGTWQAGPVGGGHLAGFAAHQAAPTWRSPDQKRPAEAALPQRAAARAVRPKRSASSAAAAQPPAAASRMHTSQGGPGTLPTSPSAAMLHGCSLAELAPLKQDSALLMSGSVPVPAAPTPRAARAPLSGSGGSGRATPVDDSGSACSSPRASLSSDPARLAAIAARVAELLAGMPAEQSAELLSVRSFLSQF